jgi:hypothetical protein
VDVVLGVVGHVVVEDVRDVVDVDAAAGHVGRHEQVDLTLAKRLDDLLALLLRDVAGHVRRGVSIVVQPPRQLFAHPLGVDEDQRALGLLTLEQAQQQRHLLVGRDVKERLLDVIDDHLVGRHRHLDRLVHEPVGQPHHGLVERRREQHRLAPVLRRDRTKQRRDVLDEPHVEHAVRLVEHEGFDGAQPQHAVSVEIQQSTRRADDDVDAVTQARGLLVPVDAAVAQADLQVGVYRELHRVRGDLDRQLARWRHDERPRAAVLRARHLEQSRHRAQQKARGLAGAGLRLARDIRAAEHDGEALRLNRRGGFEAHVRHRAQQGFGELQVRKIQAIIVLIGARSSRRPGDDLN